VKLLRVLTRHAKTFVPQVQHVLDDCNLGLETAHCCAKSADLGYSNPLSLWGGKKLVDFFWIQ
jgi:hypothetical protein